MIEEIKLAKLFHDTYERLAPSYGYETRKETREFDENSKNGQLMIATCKEILDKYSDVVIILDKYKNQKEKKLIEKITRKPNKVLKSTIVKKINEIVDSLNN